VSNPVGRAFMGEDDKIKELVGIVSEVRATLEDEPPATAYYPYWQREPSSMALVVRTTGDPETAARSVRAVLRSEEPLLAIPAIQTMEEVVGDRVAQRRFQRTLTIAFAVCALLVASLGIYGVVSYSVARRRNELGIRIALGARRGELVWLMIRQGMTPVVVGIAGGVGAALALGSAIRGLLFGIEPGDPATIAVVAVVLLAVGAAACFVPARRVAGTDALNALRAE
jgi:ABC-type lipoprotein release transport system permease subunit